MAIKTRSNKRIKAVGLVLVLLLVVSIWWLHGQNIAVLSPQGTVAQKEKSLMVTATLLGMLVIIPVYILTVVIALKYREKSHNHKSKRYEPTWDHSRWLEGAWWAVPFIIIGILSVITWRSSYDLDPFKPLASQTKPLQVQVVALDWKWLFIYPEQGVASVNEVQFPVDKPVRFQITSDTVMNSFWIPSLSGQIYAMPGMSTELNIIAHKAGEYRGSSANISGSGFAGMSFMAKADSQDAFDSWVKTASQGKQVLTLQHYTELAQPSKNNPVMSYSHADKGLYDYIVMKYMAPEASHE
jgi:cytochrome o ubiquinol oxidase subunit II